jgi:antitoxin MazE
MYIRREEPMRTRIQKWGNSLGLRIPKSLALEARVEAGSEVELSVVDSELVVKPVRPPRYKLSDLLRKVTRKNVHGEIDTGGPEGRESW